MDLTNAFFVFMKRFNLFISLFLTATAAFSQHTHKLKADSVLITSDQQSSELIIQNSTKSVPGFLFNRGNGRTEFRRGITKLNDSIWLIGADTFDIKGLKGLGLSVYRDGLIKINDSLFLGDTVYETGSHQFNRHRFQQLNGHYYSIGGTAHNADSFPVFRFYNNGDFTANATNNYRGLHRNGLRYTAHMGYLQLGLSDFIDTTISNLVYIYSTSAIILNSSDSGSIAGQLLNAFIGTSNFNLLPGKEIKYSIISGNKIRFGSSLAHSLIGGSSNFIGGANSIILIGDSLNQVKGDQNSAWFGYKNENYATTNCSITAGMLNKFGAAGQLSAGAYLTNKSHTATALGNANVDFASLPYNSSDSLLILNTHNIERQSLLFSLGNSASKLGQTKSNALTILNGGRIQVNTTGFDIDLSQTDVTPKAAFEVVSNNSGVLLPKLTTAQRNAIAVSDLYSGLLMYNTDSVRFQYYTGTYWKTLLDTTSAGSTTLDSDLVDIASLSASNNDILQRKSGAWTNRTPAQIKIDLALVKSDAGLGSVDNNSDGTYFSASATLTNKRITKRVGTTTSSSTPTPDSDTYDMYTITALSTGATFAAPAGNPTDRQVLLLRIKDNGTSRTLSWNSIYRASTDFVLPGNTVANKTMYLQFLYNSADNKWDCNGYTNGF